MVSNPKRILIGLAALIVLGVGALAAYWVSENQRFDDMRAAVDQFDPPSQWTDLVLSDQVDRSYSPLCVASSVCPYTYRRYVTSAQMITVDDVTEALTASGYSEIDAPSADCLQGDRCDFTAMINGVDVQLVTSFVRGSGQQSLRDKYDIPAGFTAFTVIVAAD